MSTPAVDLSVLAGLDEMLADPAQTAELLREFTRDARRWVRELAQTTTTGRGTPGHRAAHTLAPSATMVGAIELGRVATELEHALAGGTLPPPESLRRPTGLLDDAIRVWEASGRLEAGG